MTDEQIIDDILRREQGWTDHPADRGGPTMRGITRPTLEAYRGGVVSLDDLRVLTEEEARRIYRLLYIAAPGFRAIGDDRTRALAVDFGVHSGPRRATQALQRVLGLTPDGLFGLRTRTAVAAADRTFLYRGLLEERLLFLFDLVSQQPSQMRFVRGWTRRWMEFL